MTARPRVLFVARMRLRRPIPPSLERRYEALSHVLDWRQLASDGDGDGADDTRFLLVPRFPVARLEGAVYHVLLPARVARALRSLDPDAVIVQGAHETALVLLARAAVRSRVAVIADIHGDWRVATRLYGSSLRSLLNPVADALARLALRRADGVRTITPFTSSLVRALGREPTAEFPAYMDFTAFAGTPPVPLPDRPTAVFVGVLERYKGIDVLADAWPRVVEQVPGARLRIVGDGTQRAPVEALVAAFPASVDWTPALEPEQVAAALDEATVLVLPSRLEGMGRVLVEAFCRGRGVVASDAGGVPDVVEDGVTGLLVHPERATALADALGRVLGEPETAARIGAAAAAASVAWVVSAEAFAERTRALVDAAVAARGRRGGPRR
ncbi:MAG: glycosyltransferase family 4 protein [Actinobacteria bacterium]|nr:glycosyltransferase family 4 protein [Actinomycetota bacterium]